VTKVKAGRYGTVQYSTVQYSTVQYSTGNFRGKLGSNPRIILFE